MKINYHDELNEEVRKYHPSQGMHHACVIG